MTKMTYVDALNAVLTSDTTMSDEVREKLVALRDATAKRNETKSNKPTKTQQANAGLREALLVLMGAGEALTPSEWFARASAEDAGFTSVQKVSALLTQLVADGKVAKSAGEKRKTLYAVAKAKAE